MSEECIFCKIVSKQRSSDIVFEDELLMVIKDINPQMPAHLLIVPKEHISDMNCLTEAHAPFLVRLALVAKDIAKQEGLDECGWRLVMNCGPDAKQTVFHLHVHLLGGRPMTGQLA
jgi:histidine triad (HIT) family protein